VHVGARTRTPSTSSKTPDGACAPPRRDRHRPAPLAAQAAARGARAARDDPRRTRARKGSGSRGGAGHGAATRARGDGLRPYIPLALLRARDRRRQDAPHGRVHRVPVPRARHPALLRAGAEPDGLREAQGGLHAEHPEVRVPGTRGHHGAVGAHHRRRLGGRPRRAAGGPLRRLGDPRQRLQRRQDQRRGARRRGAPDEAAPRGDRGLLLRLPLQARRPRAADG
jgi:hypothetical protein